MSRCLRRRDAVFAAVRSFDESNLAQVLGGQVPVSTLEESVAAMATKFKELQASGQLTDKDL